MASSTPKLIVSAKPKTVVFVGLALVAIIAAYLNSLHVPFVFDDRVAVVENSSIRHLWPIGDVLSPPRTGGNTVSGRPLLNLSLAVNYALGGISVEGYHALNLCIHFLATLTLFGVIRRTLQLPWMRQRFGSVASLIAAFAALLWAVHPLLTQAVTYVAQRAEVQTALFYLLTLYAFIRSAEETCLHRTRWRWLSFLVCLAGMATKEVMVTAPVVVFLYDRTFLRGTFRETFRQRGRYYLALASTWLLLAYLVASTGGNRGGSLGFGAGVPWWRYAATECGVIFYYIKLAIWPQPLVFEYESAWATTAAQIIPYALVILGLLVATTIGLFRRSALGFCGICFFIILSPTSSVVPMQAIAEYRMYLPLALLVTAVTCLLYQWLKGKAYLLLALLIVLCGAATAERNTDYQSELDLWRDTATKRPASARAHCNFGIALLRAGRNVEAVAQLKDSIRLSPELAEAHASLGNALLQLARPAEAAKELEEAVRLKPYDAEAQNNLGNALLQLDRPGEAKAHYEAAVNLNPNFAEAHFNLGNAALQSGQAHTAIKQYQLALALTPDDAEIHNNLGTAFYQENRLEDAKREFAFAAKLRPNDPEAFNNLGLVLSQLHLFEQARTAYRHALELRPNFPEALDNLRRLDALQPR